MNILRTTRNLVIGATLLASTAYVGKASASAPQGSTGTVTKIDVSYMPATIVFRLSTGDTYCPAGKDLSYSAANPDTVKAVYALLLAAQLSGRLLNAMYWTDSVDKGPFGTNACAMTVINMN